MLLRKKSNGLRLIASEFDFSGCRIHAVNDCQRFHSISLGTQTVAAFLKSFFHCDTNAFHRTAGLMDKVDQTPCLEVSTMFLSEHQNQNIQISAYLSHFFYARNYFNFFCFYDIIMVSWCYVLRCYLWLIS